MSLRRIDPTTLYETPEVEELLNVFMSLDLREHDGHVKHRRLHSNLTKEIVDGCQSHHLIPSPNTTGPRSTGSSLG